MATHCDYKFKEIRDSGTQKVVTVFFYEGEFQDLKNADGKIESTYVRTAVVAKREYKFSTDTPVEKIRIFINDDMPKKSQLIRVPIQDTATKPDVTAEEKII